ncbi:carboxypeptidase-like regulatory domain-containing protein [Paenibacillus sp. KQZ6P-2]|uniref:Carboxypeptidase-like regulatory domain-containing protein n=1 Tax=Paenibacillus mangrovi TaxID=2931978 RepID=A0A9X1WJJ7_9BACL|nr:carboxypeptidase-like regulatory domain-containing protein [Paenibacillus mangrovi]MCJ8010537.1 carboxypeptidase-like regulatory domain-containing protein [Paenibacillus mangrovi]
MKIRIKVKHVVYILGLFLVLIVGLNYGTSPAQRMAEADRGSRQADAEKKEEILRSIDAAKPDEKLKLIEEHMLNDRSSNLPRMYDVYIGPGGTMFSGRSMEVDTRPEFNLKEMVPYLEFYVQSGSSDPDVSTAAKLLAYYYEGSGQWDKASQMLENALERLHITQYTYARNELIFMQVKLAAEQGQYDELLQLSEKLIQENKNQVNPDTMAQLSEYLAQYALVKGKAPEVLKWIQTKMEQQQKQTTDERVHNLYTDQLMEIQNRLSKLTSGGKKALTEVTGTITKSNGEPVAYAGVFLRRQEDDNHSINESEPYQTMTNEHGEYSFEGVLPGSYKLYLGLNISQINGWTWPVLADDGWIDLKGQAKVQENVVFQPLMKLKFPVNEEVIRDKALTFEWEPVAGAAYYNLNVGMKLKSGSSSRTVKQGIVTSRVQIPVQDLYDQISGVSSYSNGNEKVQLDPLSLLGYANTKNQFSWGVEAYSADGKLLTRSDGYRLSNDLTGNLPFFYLKERKMTDADKTLLSGKLDKAEAMYKADADRDPTDMHALHMMLTVLEGKMMLIRGDGKADTDTKKALEAQQVEILERLVELYPTDVYYNWLSDYYFKQADWNNYNRYYTLVKSVSRMKDNSYSDGKHGIALMKQEKPDEAAVYFKESVENDSSHRFIGTYLALHLFMGDSLDEGIQLAAKYPDRMMYNNPLNWEELLLAMKRESTGKRDYSAVLKDKIRLYIQGKDEELKLWQPSADSGLTAMKKFMDALQQVG